MIHCLKNTYGEFDATRKIGPATWPHFDLIFIHEGVVRIRMMDQKEVRLKSGQAVLIYPGTLFEGHTLTPLTKCSVHHFETEAKEYADKKQGFEVFMAGPMPVIEQDIRRLVRLSFTELSKVVEKMRAAIMNLILLQFQVQEETQAKPQATGTEFEPLVQWLRGNLREPVTIRDMAVKSRRSESHFRALFKSQMGIGPGAYFLTLRLDEATRLLRETLLPIKEIAANVGYGQASHFYRAFQTQYKTTPKTYRLEHSPLA